MSSTESLYTDAQANEILRTAVRLAAPADITFEELVSAAGEIGLTRDDLAEAEKKFAESTTEAGQRAEFRRMQRTQLKASAFQGLLIVLIVLLILLLEFPTLALWLCGPAFFILAIYVGYRYTQLRDDKELQNVKVFEDWQHQKKIWLRPERMQEIVDGILNERRSHEEYVENERPKSMLERRLRKRLGLDRKRARKVLEAYALEHPDWSMESLFD